MSLQDLLFDRYGDADDLELEGNSTITAMAGRGSCRSFQEMPVDTRIIRMLCAVALASPTKSDLQQRDIIIVEDPVLRARLDDLFPEFPWIPTAPAFLVFCGNNRRQRHIAQWREIPFANDHLDAFFNASVDAGIALNGFVIAAESMGLGCCPVSAIRNHAQTVSEMLELPDHVFPIAGLALGWPRSKPEISMRLPLSATVHNDRYSEHNLRAKVDDYDDRRASVQPYDQRRYVDEYGNDGRYGWSEDKARQYSKPEREDFGAYIRKRGFKLD